ncbi:MAG TPA: aspartate dehydrogenase [Hyphomicrobiaceae bacterium]|jgi:aspartate dehydrogenase|nr:aspartate dehydrogenase [Hyphomicrobiaceae bacterium]
MAMTRPPLKLAVAGLGAIGLAVARRVDAGDLPGIALVAAAARDHDKARSATAGFRAAPVLTTLAGLAEVADVVLECLPAAHFAAVAEPAIAAGRVLMPLSVGALLDHWGLVARAEETGARILVPTGALLGLDAVRAAAEGTISSVRMITRKPPAGLAGAPLLVKANISVEGLTAPLLVFEGSAREAIAGFPANVNVAVALSLAGIGPDRTRVEIWADPAVTRNTHSIVVTSDSSDLTMTIQNLTSVENPRTGRITALSALAALRRLTATLVVGT